MSDYRNVAQPAHAASVAKLIALKSGIPKETPAVCVHRNCASGMESITTGVQRLLWGYPLYFGWGR